jgi:cell division protein FtsB
MSTPAETIIIAREASPRRAPTRRRRAQGSHMSVVVAPPLKSQPRTSPRRRVLPTRSKYFAVLILAVLTLGLLGMLLVNTALAQGAFTLTSLQQQRAQLLEQEQALRAQVALAEAPAQVEVAARELGMVPQDVPVFLRLTDGAILGNPVPQPAPIAEEPVIEELVADELVTDELVTDDLAVEAPTADNVPADPAPDVQP